jgi:surfactin synthase thioesterase subunit
MNTIRICGLSKRSKRNVPAVSAGDRFGHHFLAGGHFALSDRRTALGAEIIEELAIGQN